MNLTRTIAEYEAGVHRVRADADGEPLWFESSDIELRPSAEAFGCALLVAALAEGRPLSISENVSLKWLSNIEQLLVVFNEWWGYPCLPPKAPAFSSDHGAEVTGTALCFSGGVDSFYTLLRSHQKIDLLATVHGYDIKLQDATRMAAFKSSLQSIAAATGAKPIIIRTNLREHPAFARASWEHAHGGALAAIGHLLGHFVDRLLISSSYGYSNDTPWGSHWRTDPLWSSDRLRIVHFGAELQRTERLRAIAGEPLVRRHLRVCWENRTAQGNCSHCEKCLRTRLILADCGELLNYPVFEGEQSLAGHINALPAIKGYGRVFSDLLERGHLSRDVKKALRKLIRRTKRARSYPRSLAKNTLRKVFSWPSNRRT